MKGFCIYIRGLPESEQMAKRCVDSGRSHDMGISYFEATHRYEAFGIAASLGIATRSYDYLDTKADRSLRETQAGCFLSHFRLWQKCVNLGEAICIFEHDAVLNTPIPRSEFQHVLNLQDSIWNDPTWRFYHKVNERLRDLSVTNETPAAGVTKAKFLCLPSACAYAITPSGASKLMTTARKEGALPVDLFVNKTVVDIRDLLPSPVTGRHQHYSTVGPNADWSQFRQPKEHSGTNPQRQTNRS